MIESEYQAVVAHDCTLLSEAVSAGDMVRVGTALRALIAHLRPPDCLETLSRVVSHSASIFAEHVPSLSWARDLAALMSAGDGEGFRQLLRPGELEARQYYECIGAFLGSLAEALQAGSSILSGDPYLSDATDSITGSLRAVHSLLTQFQSPDIYAIWWARVEWEACGSEGPEPCPPTIALPEANFDGVQRVLTALLERLEEIQAKGEMSRSSKNRASASMEAPRSEGNAESNTMDGDDNSGT